MLWAKRNGALLDVYGKDRYFQLPPLEYIGVYPDSWSKSRVYPRCVNFLHETWHDAITIVIIFVFLLGLF